ncbi:MAG: YlbF family regulator [Bacillota bacterium]
MTTVLEAARELCIALKECEEYKRLRASETYMGNDPDAQDLTCKYNTATKTLSEIFGQGKVPSKEDFENLRSLEAAMSEDETVGPYLAAQKEFEDLLKEVNKMINAAIQGPGSPGSCNCGHHHPGS